MKRFVSYLYSIYNNQKIHNAGFARMELRTGRNRIDIHLKENGYAGKTGTVYLFIRKQENIQGISIGNITFRNNQADFRYEQVEENIGQTPWQIMQMQGILVLIDGQAAFLSQWDEQPVDTTRFEVWNPDKLKYAQPDDETKEQEVQEETASVQKSQAAQTKTQNARRQTNMQTMGRGQTVQVEAQNTGHKQAAQVETQTMGHGQTAQVETQTMGREQTVQVETQTAGYKQTAQAETQIVGHKQAAQAEAQTAGYKQTTQTETQTMGHGRVAQAEAQNTAYRSGMQINVQNEYEKQNLAGEIQIGSEEAADSLQQTNRANMDTTEMPTTGSGQALEAEPTKIEVEPNSGQFSDIQTAELQPQPQNAWNQTWRYMLRTYPLLNEFADKNNVLCVRIEIKDVRLLPEKYWSMINNSFLLHGFFNYRHLAFGRIEQNWFVGVPGIYQNQEHAMASIFGFPDFLPQKQKNERGEQPGYWYRILESV